jgi:hypothetical protein
MVVEVTNLKDSGAGSLRQALTTNKGVKRTIVFTVSGTIVLASPIEVKYDSLITIAGQTAPGDGICIRDFPITFSDSKEIIVRYIRSRLGDQQTCTDCDIDAISIRKCHHIILDHCSFSWSIDAVTDLTVETGYSTVQYCMIYEALLNSKHSKGAHSMGTGWDGNSHGDHGVFGGGSYHHNLIASCNTRTPRIDSYAGEDNTGVRDLVDIVNNVIYNWSGNGAYGGENADVNWQNNYYKYGPNTTSKRNQILQPDGECKVYLLGNYVESYPAVTADNTQGIYLYSTGKVATATQLDTILKSAPFSVWSINMQTAQDAYAKVLAEAGASLPKRDSTDIRVVDNVINRTGKIIDSQSQVGGWAVYSSSTSPVDTDHDGMPDDWENFYGFNPNLATDRNNDADGDGYTNLEEYLNGLPIVKVAQVVSLDTILPKALGIADFNLSVTNTTGLALTYTSSNNNVATIVNNKVHIVGAGTCTISVSNAGNLMYSAIAKTRTLVVYASGSVTQTITFGPLPSVTDGYPDFSLTATSTSGLPVSFQSSNLNVATITADSKIHLVGPGTATITATQAGDNTYSAAQEVTQSIIVRARKTQTMTFGQIPTKAYGDEDFEPATVSSGLPLVYSVNDTSVIGVSAQNKIHIKKPGSTTITASQPGDTAHYPATSIIRQITVTKASQAISLDSIPVQKLSSKYYVLQISTSSGLEPTIYCFNSKVATISGDTLKFTGAGTSGITATQSGNSNYFTATSVRRTLVIEDDTPTGVNAVTDHPFRIYPTVVSSLMNIEIEVAEPAEVEVSIIDCTGRKFADLYHQQTGKGPLTVQWNCAGLPAGYYICRFKVGTKIYTSKIVKAE